MTRPELPWRNITFPTHSDPRGSLTMAQGGEKGLVPFEIKRTYWLHDLAVGGERGSHATFHTQQVMIPVIGGADFLVSDGVTWRTHTLVHTPGAEAVMGLYVGGGVWREVRNIRPGTVILILSDTLYEDADYVREWTDYIKRVADGEDKA